MHSRSSLAGTQDGSQMGDKTDYVGYVQGMNVLAAPFLYAARSEAEAFAAFIDGATKAYDLDPEKLVYLGYSNGANLINAMLSLHPQLIRRAVLLRSMPALDAPPAVDMSDAEVLMISGEADDYGPYGEALRTQLAAAGADVDLHFLPHGHELTEDDVPIVQAWLARL